MVKILVIGGGPGGHLAAMKAAELGAEVTIVEKTGIGGTCLNVGCIPTKILLHATELYEDIQHAGAMGLTVSDINLNMKQLHNYKNNILNNICNGVTEIIKSKNVKILNGVASFTSPKTAEIVLSDGTEKEIEFDKAIIATGSEVSMFPIPGIDNKNVIISDQALSLPEAPKNLVIVGGGVIGIEFASLYSRLGTKVTIIEAKDQILPFMDTEMVSLISKNLEKKGIEIYTNSFVSSIEDHHENTNVVFMNNGKEEVVEGDKILVCTGRKPFTSGLGIEKAGVELDNRGAVIVNEYMGTNQPHIYALGDCTGGMMLAHVASEQGLVAGTNIVKGDEEKFDISTTPSCVYLDPEFAGVGLTEERARAMYSNIKIGTSDLAGNAKVMTMGKSGMVKFIVDGDTDQVLGLHIFGPRASDMIHEGALAIKLGATIEDIIKTIHAHPTIAEAILEAAHDVRGNAPYKMYAKEYQLDLAF